MLKIHIVTPTVIEASVIPDPLRAGVGAVGKHIAGNGFLASLPELGVEIEGITQPEPIDLAMSDDRVERLGAFNAQIAKAVSEAIERGARPFLAGGACSHLPGMVGGLEQAYGSTARIGLIWMDAHTDMNTPGTSPSGNVHGMPLACLIGTGPKALTHLNGWGPKVDPKNVVLIGIRDVDLDERPLVRRSGVRVFTMRDVDERGMRTVMHEALAVAGDGTDGIHLSLDMDGVDPREAPGVGTPVRGGFSYREAHLAMEIICDSRLMRSMEVVEVNPILDDANRTALLAVELVLSAMGKRIL